ncbi:MAG: UPF0182 family membrane protein [Acidimicrobiales bacterium]
MPAPKEMTGRAAGRGALVAVGVIVFVVLLSLRAAAGYFTDFLWFSQLGQGGTWVRLLGTRIGLGSAFTLAFFALMWINLAVADRLNPRVRPVGGDEQFVERFHEVVGTRTGAMRLVVSAVFALVAGPGVAAQWDAWLRFTNHVPFGITDALLGVDIGFFVFQLPFLSFLVDWLFLALVVVLTTTGLAYYLNGGIRLRTPLEKVSSHTKAHLSVLLAVLALIRAGSYYLQRFELTYSRRGAVQGAGFTDVTARLPALKLLIVISLVACVLLVVNISRRGWVLPAIAGGLWLLVAVVVGGVIPAVIQKFRVEPAESTFEPPYIRRNIEATRDAYNLDIESVPYEAVTTNADQTDLTDYQSTIRNVRLWDPEITLDSYKRLQGARGYFEIADVDVDRYLVDGQLTQVLVATRELAQEKIPSQTWVNRHLGYTHGYGAVITPSSGVTDRGDPAFRLSNVPLEGDHPFRFEGDQARPDIYFGEGLDGYAVVETKEFEIGYSSGEEGTKVRYGGEGGVVLDSWTKRAAMALRFGDFNMMISPLITSDSRVLFQRNIDERVRRLAPFLHYDSDPYAVVIDGRVKWIYDAYTTSSWYPYSQRAEVDRVSALSGLRDVRFNYVRNSVKTVIDAYDGTTEFFIVDDEDPVAQAYSAAFPGLLRPGTEMDPEVREHLRYPEDLFRVQSDLFAQYHVTSGETFYGAAERWEVAQRPGGIDGTARTAAQLAPNAVPTSSKELRMDPYYLLMRLPDEDEESFVMLQPFVPASADDARKELRAFLVATSDGRLKAYETPTDRSIDGPARVNDRIQQDAEVSRFITLLNQSGSKVRVGNLLLIPLENLLLYVQPLYVQASSGSATPTQPQLEQVIVAVGDRVVMRPTLREALTVIFGSSPPTLEERVAGQVGEPPSPSGDPQDPVPNPSDPDEGVPTAAEILARAQVRFDSAEEALRRGDLAGYQRFTQEARDLIGQAADLLGPPTEDPVDPPIATA